MYPNWQICFQLLFSIAPYFLFIYYLNVFVSLSLSLWWFFVSFYNFIFFLFVFFCLCLCNIFQIYDLTSSSFLTTIIIYVYFINLFGYTLVCMFTSNLLIYLCSSHPLCIYTYFYVCYLTLLYLDIRIFMSPYLVLTLTTTLVYLSLYHVSTLTSMYVYLSL